VLIAQWPVREFIPDPDPIGVVYFADADPVFAMTEHLKEPVVIRPTQDENYQKTIEEGTSIPQVSVASVPLLSDEITTGILGFIKYGDREWLDGELDALKTIATLFAQLQARIAAESRLRYLADHDDLTGLYNRRSLMGHLEKTLQSEDSGPVAVMFLDLDRLKAINDYLGHASGDRFLTTFADRLREATNDDAVIARLGGDEFVVIPNASMGIEAARAAADDMHRRLRQSVIIEGESFLRTVSIGVAVGVPGVHTADSLLTQADQALLSAKSTGGDVVAVFTPDLALRNDLRNDVELHLAGSIENEALVVHYLPEVDLRNAEIVAVEALVRWNHPTRGILYPDVFVPVAEASGLASELGRLVLRAACTHLKRWRSMGLGADLVMRVNVSPVQLVSDGFADSVAEIIRECDIDAGSICLEITESLVVDDLETVKANMDALKTIGTDVAIDDFGTGYSALSRLKSLPVDVLKIDQSFVRNLGHDPGDFDIVRATVALAGAFGLEVVAEGVETEIAARTLLAVGCYRAQGYLLSRPVDDMAMQEMLKNPYLPLPSQEPAAPAPNTNGSGR
jgi:diguanylate cyclase (GGDEF)-like protein